MIGTSSWKEQFIEALTVTAGKDEKNCDDVNKKTHYKLITKALMGSISFSFFSLLWRPLGDDDGDDGEEGGMAASPSCFDYVMHFLTLFWKILFAFIPPTGKFEHTTDFIGK